MARRIETLPPSDDYELHCSEEQVTRLGEWACQELDDAVAALSYQYDVYEEALRQYEGVPKKDIINTPVLNAPNVQVTLGAIACDSIYAQALDTILTTDPLVTVRPTTRGSQEEADALSDLIRHVAVVEARAPEAAEDGILDDVILGTGFYYIPWVEEVVRKRTYAVRSAGPRIIAMPIEDVIVPAGASGGVQDVRWLGLRFWLTEAELTDRANLRQWDTEQCSPAAAGSRTRDRREMLGHTGNREERKGDIYEIVELYCSFDVNEDDIEEDLFVVVDRTSRKVLYYDYNPYESRPGAVMRYQKRAHLFYGIGVMEMIQPFQEEVTDIHNWRNLNMRLANARIWKAKTGALPKGFTFWENRVVYLENPQTDLVPEQMGDIYPSSAQAEAISTNLASRRVGEIEQNFSRPSALLGSRTPATTAMTAMAQVNRRFTAAFNAMRLGLSEAIKQCLYRYQERVMADDQDTIQHIRDICSAKNAQILLTLLKDPHFDDAYVVEMTASSSMINKAQDRNDAMLMVQITTQYYQGLMALVQLMAAPTTPPPVKMLAEKIATAAGSLVEHAIRTFDQIRDPEAFIIEMDEVISGAMAGTNPGIVGMLAGLLGGPNAAQGQLPAQGVGGAEAIGPVGGVGDAGGDLGV